MKIDKFDLDQDVLVVAEIGNNHEGSQPLAEQMISLAARAGVGAVKFQTFRTEQYVSRVDKARFDRLKSFELSYRQFESLSRVAQDEGILFFSTPFDIESAHALNSFCPIFKISSGDNNFYPLIEAVAAFGKPVILSSGLADVRRIRYSKALIESVWDTLGIEQETAVLHCVSSYPVPWPEVGLGAIPLLRRELGCTVGYSDHTMGIEAAILSVALGARIVEKHFTIDKNYSDFRDHQLSADPADMSELVRRIREVQELIGTGKKNVTKSEQSVMNLMRRSIAAKRALPAGKTIQLDDLTWIRPGDGLPPGRENQVLGRSLARAVQAGDIITPDMLLDAEQ